MSIRILRNALVPLAALAFAACVSGSMTYTPPPAKRDEARTVVVERSRDELWKAVVANLAESVFVINTIDATSGLINLSYSGDPEEYIECGQILSKVTNARGPRQYDFPGARAYMEYEVADGSNLFFVARSMSLEGRANIVLGQVSPASTKMTVNVRYIVTRSIRVRDVMDRETNASETISFNSGESASFPSGTRTTCRSTGALERRLLRLAPPE